MQVFDKDQLHYISKGQVHQKTLRNQVSESLHSNPFNSNFIISSMPGLGKSFEINAALKNINTDRVIKFDGNSSMPALTVEIATALYLVGKERLVVILDDCDVLFLPNSVNTTKKMFDDTKMLKYGKLPAAIKAQCTDMQKEAIEYFSDSEKVGFEVPLNNVTFIILTNIHLPTVNEVEKVKSGSREYERLNSLYAIRRRTEYKEIEMGDKELWGYVANVVMNEKICEKWKENISDDEKAQILTWCYNNWGKVTERNLSLVEKMTRDMIRYPSDYLDIWSTNYL